MRSGFIRSEGASSAGLFVKTFQKDDQKSMQLTKQGDKRKLYILALFDRKV